MIEFITTIYRPTRFRKRLAGFGLFLLSLTIIACEGNFKDVVIEGQLRDSLTNQEIVGARINVTCWVYDMEIWESRKVIKEAFSDDAGNFSIEFDKGNAIDLEIVHANYDTLRFSKNLKQSVNELDFKLEKEH